MNYLSKYVVGLNSVFCSQFLFIPRVNSKDGREKCTVHKNSHIGSDLDCSAHGLGTAALAGKEPEALPYCAIAYAITGIVSTLLCTIPPVRTSLLMIAGAA